MTSAQQDDTSIQDSRPETESDGQAAENSDDRGCFFSIAGAMALAVSALFIWNGARELAYGLKDEPIRVERVEQVQELADNDFVEMSLDLDQDRSLAVATVGGSEYTLTPVRGSNLRLIVFQRGGIVEGEESVGRTFRGRIVGGDVIDEWDIDGNRIKLIDLFDRKGIKVPADALVLAQGSEPAISVWGMVVMGIGVLVWLWFFADCVALVRGRGEASVGSAGHDDARSS